MPSKIGWTTETWNPFHGCTKVSAGCKNCYAERYAKRLAAMGAEGYTKAHPFAVRYMNHKLDEPYHWRQPRLVFLSMGDLFHKHIPTAFIEGVFQVMDKTPRHIYQVLTKRPARMVQFANRGWPKNVWLGVSIENNEALVDRIPYAREIARWLGRSGLAPIHRRKFVSYEPALEWVSWGHYLNRIDWLIVGCESGPKRRPFKNEWAASTVAACHSRDIPVYVKQIIVDGKVSTDPSEWPPELRVQEYPPAMMRVLEARR